MIVFLLILILVVLMYGTKGVGRFLGGIALAAVIIGALGLMAGLGDVDSDASTHPPYPIERFCKNAEKSDRTGWADGYAEKMDQLGITFRACDEFNHIHEHHDYAGKR